MALEMPELRFHDLRHTYASFLAAAGASTREIAELLGHTNLHLVQRYSHFTSEHLRNVVRKL